MASTDARPVPIKGTAFRIYFALRLNTGGLNSGAAGLDSEVSKDGGTFADCTNEATEIATSSGIYFLDITSTEMNADNVSVIVKSSTTNAVTFDAQLYPQETGDIKVDIQSINASATAAVAQQVLADEALGATVDSGSYSPTTVDFETSITTNLATDFYKGRSIIFTSGTLKDQAARITGSTFTANSKIKLTVTTLTAAPANAVGFRIV